MKKLITRFGEFWQREDLFTVTKKQVVWNAERSWYGKKPPLEGARGIYILYKGRNPVYIGKALKGENPIAKRLDIHARRWISHAWDNVSWYHFDSSVEDSYIEAVESLLIVHVQGTLNGSVPSRHLGKKCYPGNDKNYARNTLWQKG